MDMRRASLWALLGLAVALGALAVSADHALLRPRPAPVLHGAPGAQPIHLTENAPAVSDEDALALPVVSLAQVDMGAYIISKVARLCDLRSALISCSDQLSVQRASFEHDPPLFVFAFPETQHERLVQLDVFLHTQRQDTPTVLPLKWVDQSDDAATAASPVLVRVLQQQRERVALYAVELPLDTPAMFTLDLRIELSHAMSIQSKDSVAGESSLQGIVYVTRARPFETPDLLAHATHPQRQHPVQRSLWNRRIVSGTQGGGAGPLHTASVHAVPSALSQTFFSPYPVEREQLQIEVRSNAVLERVAFPDTFAECEEIDSAPGPSLSGVRTVTAGFSSVRVLKCAWERTGPGGLADAETGARALDPEGAPTQAGRLVWRGLVLRAIYAHAEMAPLLLDVPWTQTDYVVSEWAGAVDVSVSLRAHNAHPSDLLYEYFQPDDPPQATTARSLSYFSAQAPAPVTNMDVRDRNGHHYRSAVFPQNPGMMQFTTRYHLRAGTQIQLALSYRVPLGAFLRTVLYANWSADGAGSGEAARRYVRVPVRSPITQLGMVAAHRIRVVLPKGAEAVAVHTANTPVRARLHTALTPAAAAAAGTAVVSAGAADPMDGLESEPTGSVSQHRYFGFLDTVGRSAVVLDYAALGSQRTGDDAVVWVSYRAPPAVALARMPLVYALPTLALLLGIGALVHARLGVSGVVERAGVEARQRRLALFDKLEVCAQTLARAHAERARASVSAARAQVRARFRTEIAAARAQLQQVSEQLAQTYREGVLCAPVPDPKTTAAPPDLTYALGSAAGAKLTAVVRAWCELEAQAWKEDSVSLPEAEENSTAVRTVLATIRGLGRLV